MMADAGQASEEHLQYAAKLFAWGLALNPKCTLPQGSHSIQPPTAASNAQGPH